MRRLKRAMFLVVLCAASGCAVPGTSNLGYIPPSVHEVENERLVDRPFDEVWDTLVEELARSFFVINNIEKESRIINVSISVDNPEMYVDCGQSHRTYRRGKEEKEYIYEIAASSTYKSAGVAGINPVTYYMQRDTSLEGRVNIYIAPRGGGTLVAVNARYVLTASVRGTYEVENTMGVPTGSGAITPSTASLNLDSTRPGTDNWGTAQEPMRITCYSTGELEREILEMLD